VIIRQIDRHEITNILIQHRKTQTRFRRPKRESRLRSQPIRRQIDCRTIRQWRFQPTSKITKGTDISLFGIARHRLTSDFTGICQHTTRDRYKFKPMEQ